MISEILTIEHDQPIEGFLFKNRTGMDLTINWEYDPETGLVTLTAKPSEKDND